MEDELIEAVRRKQCLYDIKHPDYVKIKLKDSIWKQIAESLNIKDGYEAKKTWEKLRNNHRDALRRQKRSGAVNIRPWRFQDNMAFLIPHMANRPTSINIHEETQNDEPLQAHLFEAHFDTKEIDIKENSLDYQDSRTGNEETNSPEPPSDVSTDQVNKRRRHKRNSLNDLLNRSIENHQFRVVKRQREREHLSSNDFTCNNVKNDPLFHFFISMYETTKRLSPLSQHTIKTNIFSLVSEEESKMIVQYSPRPHSSE